MYLKEDTEGDASSFLAPPRLRFEKLLPTLFSTQQSSGPRFNPFWGKQKLLQRVKDAGFEGVAIDKPFTVPTQLINQAGLHAHISYRYQKAENKENLSELAPQWREQNLQFANLFIGSGFESDDEASRIIEDLLNHQAKTNFPVFVETHRGCVTQDIQRTLMLVNKFPELKITGDFSHWIMASAITEERFSNFIETIEPILQRVAYLQARIGNSQQIQIANLEGSPSLFMYKKIWQRIFEIFLSKAQPGEVLPFAPEILPSLFGYSVQIKNAQEKTKEPFDRWQQMLMLKEEAILLFNKVIEDKMNAKPAGSET